MAGEGCRVPERNLRRLETRRGAAPPGRGDASGGRHLLRLSLDVRPERTGPAGEHGFAGRPDGAQDVLSRPPVGAPAPGSCGPQPRPRAPPRRERDRQGAFRPGAPSPLRSDGRVRRRELWCDCPQPRGGRALRLPQGSLLSGADRDHPGLLRASSGGTLFLDEIGDLPCSRHRLRSSACCRRIRGPPGRGGPSAASRPARGGCHQSPSSRGAGSGKALPPRPAGAPGRNHPRDPPSPRPARGRSAPARDTDRATFAWDAGPPSRRVPPRLS